jgi:ssDNA-binding Zn-finger/Zn-ribbon topoisomerase 1
MSEQGERCPKCGTEMLRVMSGPEKGQLVCYPCDHGSNYDDYYCRLFNELAEHGYFELSPYRVPSTKHVMWRLSWREKRGHHHGWRDMKVFGSTPWDVMTQYNYWLNKKEAEEDYFETNILPDVQRSV